VPQAGAVPRLARGKSGAIGAGGAACPAQLRSTHTGRMETLTWPVVGLRKSYILMHEFGYPLSAFPCQNGVAISPPLELPSGLVRLAVEAKTRPPGIPVFEDL
jgi:hypothetical protein